MTQPGNDAVGVVVVTHGDAARFMIEAAEHMVGPLGVVPLSVPIGEAPAETERRLEEITRQLPAESMVFLVDLEGSTPYNLCCRRCRGRSVVVTGMNMPMLFKLATADRTRGPDQLADELRATGVKSIHVRPMTGSS